MRTVIGWGLLVVMAPCPLRMLAAQEHTTVGGYGEVHYTNPTGPKTPPVVNLARFVVYLAHSFDERLAFRSELEVEDAKIEGGQAGGEVSLEQAYLDYRVGDWITLRTGLVLPPVGIINETHEPPTLHGPGRPGAARGTVVRGRALGKRAVGAADRDGEHQCERCPGDQPRVRGVSGQPSRRWLRRGGVQSAATPRSGVLPEAQRLPPPRALRHPRERPGRRDAGPVAGPPHHDVRCHLQAYLEHRVQGGLCAASQRSRRGRVRGVEPRRRLPVLNMTLALAALLVTAQNPAAPPAKVAASIARLFGPGARVDTLRVDTASVLRVSPADSLLGFAAVGNVVGKDQPITYLVAIDPTDRLKDVDILVYREPYGGEVAYEPWRRQFRGKSTGDSLRVGKEIRSISGATISVHAVTLGVRRMLAELTAWHQSGAIR